MPAPKSRKMQRELVFKSGEVWIRAKDECICKGVIYSFFSDSFLHFFGLLYIKQILNDGVILKYFFTHGTVLYTANQKYDFILFE